MNNPGAIHSNKISGLKWIATGLEGLIPRHSQKEFCAHLKWQILLLMLSWMTNLTLSMIVCELLNAWKFNLYNGLF